MSLDMSCCACHMNAVINKAASQDMHEDQSGLSISTRPPILGGHCETYFSFLQQGLESPGSAQRASQHQGTPAQSTFTCVYLQWYNILLLISVPNLHHFAKSRTICDGAHSEGMVAV